MRILFQVEVQLLNHCLLLVIAATYPILINHINLYVAHLISTFVESTWALHKFCYKPDVLFVGKAKVQYLRR